MKKILFSLIIIFCVAVGTYGGLWWKNQSVEAPRATPTVNAKSVLEITPRIESIVPIMLEVPNLNVDVAVERVGLDSKNRMDTPQNVYNTGWYEPGVKPGEFGGALIAGHYDDPQGKPSVFYRLDTLDIGDKIVVRDENNTSLTFTVYNVETYSFDKVPMGELINNTQERGLHLITCGGKWDYDSKNYTERTVVSARITE